MVSCFQFLGSPAQSKAELCFGTVSTGVRALKCTCTSRHRLNVLLLRVSKCDYDFNTNELVHLTCVFMYIQSDSSNVHTYI